MYINNNNNNIIETEKQSIPLTHVYMKLYWSGTCTLIIIKIKDIIETEKQSIPLTHVYMTVLTVLVWYMYINNNNNNKRYHRNRETIDT